MKKLIALIMFAFLLFGCSPRTLIVEEPSKRESPYTYTHKTDWWLLWENAEGKNFIDLNSIRYSSGGTVEVWLKGTVTNKGKDTERSIRKQMGVSTKGLENLSYRIGLFEVDCSNRTTRIVENFNYDEKGNLIDDPVDYMWTRAWRDKWQHIPPGTKIWHLYKYLCQ